MRTLFSNILLLLLFILSHTQKAYSDNKLFFSQIGIEEGLSQLSVLNMFQDSEGYIWYGTRNGVTRYDGYEMKIYQHEVNNPFSLTDNSIKCIAEDKDGNIWIGTANGLNMICKQTDHVLRFYPKQISDKCEKNIINSMLLHQNGNLYAFSGNKILKCSAKEIKVEKILKSLNSDINSALQMSDGDIYLGCSSDGLYVMTSALEEKYNFLPRNSHTQPNRFSGPITDILSTSEDDLWIGFEESGLAKFNTNQMDFEEFNPGMQLLASTPIRDLSFLNDSIMLIGTFRGLMLFNQKDNTIKSINLADVNKGGLNHFSIHSILVDKDSTIWVGTYSAGVNYHSPHYKPLSFLKAKEFTGIIGKGQEDKSGKMWFATEGSGLLCYDPASSKQYMYPITTTGESVYERNIIKFILLKDEMIYCTTHFGAVYRFSIKEKRFECIYDSKFNDIYSIHIDRQNRIWIPTNNENNLVMLENGVITNNFPSNGENRSFKWVNTIYEAEDGVFLFGTLSDSLYLYDYNKKTTKNLYSVIKPHNPQEKLGNITSIIQDGNSDFWISTSKSGLFKLNSEFSIIKHYYPDDGLLESFISTITIDKSKTIWVTAGKTLYKHDKDSDRFINYNLTDVPAQEFTIYGGTSVSSDGHLYFPGDKGILYFNPDDLLPNTVKPDVRITSFIVNGRRSSFNLREVTILSADQNNIEIDYTVFDFINSAKVEYQFMLEGADNNWHNAANRREAYYSNLSPGEYAFHVKASNSDGLDSDRETVLRFVIRPPFYQTWVAYFVYFLLTLSFVYLIIRYQHNKHEKQREARYKLLEQRKNNELHEERIRMFTNFSHELRTPLTLIINPLEDLLQKISFSPEITHSLRMMQKNTKRMLSLVNNLMDIRKYEAGKSVLQKERFDLCGLLEEMKASFQIISEKRNILFNIENHLASTYFVDWEEKEIEKVFLNLLSNAFKFTPAGGEVIIKVSTISIADAEKRSVFPEKIDPSLLSESRYVLVDVRDTGRCFDKDEAEKVFEPFYSAQDDIHKQIAGSGIGLSLSRAIVEQHNGLIWVESFEVGGKAFRFILPDTVCQPTDSLSDNKIAISHKNIKINNTLNDFESRLKPSLLLVDDNEEVLQYLEHQLSEEYLIRKAANGQEALDSISENRPDIIVSDVMMPVMNGLELCRNIKENEAYLHIPLILLTAKCMPSQIEEGLSMGADDYIVKPFNLSLLKARIKSLLEMRKKMKDIYGEAVSLKKLGFDISDNSNTFLSQYVEIVKSNISNADLDVAVIYTQLGMSRANFYRKVKAESGLSPIELIKNIRLEAAATLLKDSEMNVSEIAACVGFNSRSYFARSFKTLYGVSPTEYQLK